MVGARGWAADLGPGAPVTSDCLIDFVERVRQAFLVIVMAATAATSTPTPAPTPEPTPRITPAPKRVTAGLATWYRWRPGEAAAGPALREALGSNWRGQRVRVCSAGRCVKVRLTDWCACGSRNGKPTVIDLDVRSFASLALPSRGVITVEVSR